MLVAIIAQEPGALELVRKIEDAEFVGIGTPTLVEASIVIAGRAGDAAAILLERFLADLDVEEMPFGEVHWREAAVAFRRYGKGRHPARLNFGDCMTYATASLSGEPLLYVGDDFALTDLERA